MEGEGTLSHSYLYPVCGRLRALRHRARTWMRLGTNRFRDAPEIGRNRCL